MTKAAVEEVAHNHSNSVILIILRRYAQKYVGVKSLHLTLKWVINNCGGRENVTKCEQLVNQVKDLQDFMILFFYKFSIGLIFYFLRN